MNTKELKNKADYLWKILIDFKEKILDPNEMKCCLVGSFALYLHDIPVLDVHDVDIEVQCTEEQERVFKAIADVQGNTFYKQLESEYPFIVSKECTWTHKPYIFEYKGIKFNVWTVREFSHKTGFCLGNGTIVAGVWSILRKKMLYKRAKDREFITGLTSRLLELLK